MSSWFLQRFMEAWSEDSNDNGGAGHHPAMYAVDLIGCGAQHGADMWDPNERGLFIPLDWVKACEALMAQELGGLTTTVTTKESASASSVSILSSLFSGGAGTSSSSSSSSSRHYNVVVQGGLAPVGVLLASRNPQTVQRLVLTSPPTWHEMVTPVPQRELAMNYNCFKVATARCLGLYISTRIACGCAILFQCLFICQAL
jgi:hypothetical protein